tara:strand:+ start:1037 stop:1216 length:180 start_codon:yes stop_codon:yes gene_type:complete
MKKIFSTLLFFSLTFGQTYIQGDYVSDFGADICYNGNDYWSWDTHGQGKVTWIASFATW